MDIFKFRKQFNPLFPEFSLPDVFLVSLISGEKVREINVCTETDNPSPIRGSQNIRICRILIFLPTHVSLGEKIIEGSIIVMNNFPLDAKNHPPTLRIPYGKFIRKTTAAKFALIRNVNCQPPISRPLKERKFLSFCFCSSFLF